MTSRFVPHPEWRALAVACGLVAAVLPVRAHAQDQVELTWESPPECPQEAAVRQKLRSLAGDAWRTTERVSAKGRIERIDGRYRLTLAVRDGARVKERTIDSESCADLAGAAAVTLGLLLGRGANGSENVGAAAGSTGPDAAAGNDAARNEDDANARAATSGAAGAKANAASKPEKSPDSRPKDDDEDESRDAESSDSSASSGSRHFRFLARAPLLTLDFARLPKPSLGIGGGLGARYDEWRFVAVGRILRDQTLWSEQFQDIGSRVSRFTADLWICRGWRSGALELAPCVTLGIDHVTARGVGPANVTPHSARTTAVLLGGAGAAHFYLAEWMAIFASAGVAAATSKPKLSVDGLGEIGHLGAVQVSIGIGPEWIF